MIALHARSGAAYAATAAVVAAFVALTFVACKKSDDSADTTASSEAGTDGEPLFRIVQNDLIVRCGGTNGSCHVNGTVAPHWLGDPDPYLSAKNYPGILPATQDPNDSIILTQVVHEGPTLHDYPELYDHVSLWVQAEMPGPPLPTTGAFPVLSGLNIIHLDNLGDGFAGGSVSFTSNDGTGGTLTLDSITMTAPSNANLTATSPFFVVLPRSGKVKAEPSVNGFDGELTVPAGETKTFYSGSMILTGWDPTGQLKLVFKAITSAPGVGLNTACTALPLWNSSAVPAMTTLINITGDDQNDGGMFDGSVIGQGSCIGCHGKDVGTDPITAAISAMDLRTYVSDPATACLHARGNINFDDKTQSLIILNPTGKGNPNHPIVPLDLSSPVIQGIMTWVNAEQK